MTTSDRMTVRAVLLDPGHQDAGKALSAAVERGGLGVLVAGAVGGLTSVGQHVICEEAGHVADSLLDLDITDVLALAWTKHTDLVAAGRRTRQQPGSEELVPLATHTVSSTHRPCVDVFIDEVKVTDVELELTLSLVVTGVLAVVRDGRLVALHGGAIDASASLRCEHARVLERSRRLALPESWLLEPPIDLLAAPRR
jgi:hypothetical protein